MTPPLVKTESAFTALGRPSCLQQETKVTPVKEKVEWAELIKINNLFI